MDALKWTMAILPPTVLIAGLLARWWVWSRTRPALWVSPRLGVRWLPGTLRIEPEMVRALELIRSTVRAPQELWVDVYPETARLVSELSPHGFNRQGELLNGTIDSTRLFPWTRKIPVILVRQTAGDPSGARTVLHEWAAHLAPAAAGQGANRQHRLAWADQLERDLKEAFNA